MKSKLIKTFFLDIAYFLLLIIILILTKGEIRNFLINIQNYSSQLNAVNINENLEQAQILLSQVNSVASKASLFLFIIVPLTIFILYIIFQGLTFKKEKNSYKKFILINLAPFIFLILTMFTFNTYLFILWIIISYLSFILYFYDFKKLKFAITKIYKFFPLYLIYLTLQILIIGFLYLSYTRIYISIDFIWLFLLSLLFTLLFSYYKIILVEKLFN